MAYGGGYPYGYQDGTGGWTFTPDTTGNLGGLEPEVALHQSMWRHYGAGITTQQTIVFTNGVSVLWTSPSQAVLDAADAGSGNGDKMIYPTPTTTVIPLTTTETLAIIADETYGDYITQEA